jgi:hypothetical protein
VSSVRASNGARLTHNANGAVADEIHIVCPPGTTRIELQLASSARHM